MPALAPYFLRDAAPPSPAPAPPLDLDRRIWIDALKGIGAILVVLGHNGELIGHGYLRALIYSVHMPLFFAVAGLTLCRLDTRQWLARIGSLLWIYLALALAFIPFALWQNGNYVPTPTPEIPHMLAGIAYGVTATLRVDTMWFLPAMALGMLIAWPLIVLGERLSLTTRQRLNLQLGMALGMLALGATLLKQEMVETTLRQMTWAGAGSEGTLPWTARSVPFIAGFILLGRWIAGLPRQHGQAVAYSAGGLLLLWIYAWLTTSDGSDGAMLNLASSYIGRLPVWATVAAIAGTVGLIMTVRRIGRHWTLLALVGRCSLPIMVLHPMIQNLFARQPDAAGPWIGLFAGIALPMLLDRAIFHRNRLGMLLFYPRNLLRSLHASSRPGRQAHG